MAELDIAEWRLMQYGRIIFKHLNQKGLDLDLRVSTAPLNYGDGAVLRILDKQKIKLLLLLLSGLCFSVRNLSVFMRIAVRDGMMTFD